MGQVLRRTVEAVPKDPVAFWLSRLDAETAKGSRPYFVRWMRWLNQQAGWENVAPRDLLVRQLQAEDSYMVLDMAQAYLQSLVARKNTKRKAYSVIRSFFAHNRCALPEDPSFRVKGDRPPVAGCLTVPDLVEAVHAATLRFRSIILVKWQSFLDTSRLIYANQHCAEQIVSQMQTDIHPVRLELPGRKSKENDTDGRFYTYIGKDAVDALTKYFEEERGWPRKGEPLWTQHNGQPLSASNFSQTWLRIFRRTGKIPRHPGMRGTRYGYNPHELRDTATSLLHVAAKGKGFDMDCVKLWCGQVGQVDPLKYDKFYKDANYVRAQYEIAEPYLNIISNPAALQPEKLNEMAKENEELRDRLERLEGQFETILKAKLDSTA